MRVNSMGYKEEIEPISCLAPRTELSEAPHLGVHLGVQHKEISVAFSTQPDPPYDCSQGGTGLCCLLTGQPLEANRTNWRKRPPSTCARGGRTADTRQWCFFDPPLVVEKSQPSREQFPAFLMTKRVYPSQPWDLWGMEIAQGHQQEQQEAKTFPKQVPLEQTANRALLSSGFWLLQGENHCQVL